MNGDRTPTPEDMAALHQQYRELKHGLNNSLAVFLALAELGQRNPAQFEKLAKTVLVRGPEMVRQLQAFSDVLASWVPQDRDAAAPPAA